jgi:hypothetical protein
MPITEFVNRLQKQTASKNYDQRRQIAISTFNSRLADPEFFQLPYDEQDRIREKFIGMVAPVKEGVAGPEDKATGEAQARITPDIGQPPQPAGDLSPADLEDYANIMPEDGVFHLTAQEDL